MDVSCPLFIIKSIVQMRKRKNTTILKLDAGTNEEVKIGYFEFDENANRVLELQFAEDGETIDSKVVREYDEKGNNTLQVLTVGADEQSRLETSWDNLNRKVEEKLLLNQETLEYHKKMEWNDDNTKVTVLYFNEAGERISTEKNEYNSKGEPLLEQVLDNDGEVLESYKYFYAEDNGYLAKRIAEFNGFETIYMFEYEFDNDGKMVYSKVTDDDGDEESHEIEYQENGKKKEETRTQTTGASETTIYDEKEREIKVNRYDETEYLIYEASSFYKNDTHDLVTERNIRRDRQVIKLSYLHDFYE